MAYVQTSEVGAKLAPDNMGALWVMYDSHDDIIPVRQTHTCATMDFILGPTV
jgi:hypothetical protein